MLAALLTVTPGLDTALVLRTTLRGGALAGRRVARGVCAGLVLWGAAAGTGVAALLEASAGAYDALRLAGAAYVVVLGVRSLLAARRGGEGGPDTPGSETQLSARSAFQAGLMSNLLNPKIGVFYVSVLPQFVSPAMRSPLPSLLLAGIHAALGLVWLSVLAGAVTSVGPVMRRPGVRRRLEALTGFALIGFGTGLAFSERR